MPTTTVHYVVTDDHHPTAREYATIDDAVDAVVADVPVGGEFSIHRSSGGTLDEVVVRATKWSTRPRVAESPSR
jgi:hypothetical protein